MPEPFVRQYSSETDLEAIVHVFRETCDEPLKVEPIWTLGSYIWCRPYLSLTPETCFVLDDGFGKAVGYIIGTPNTLDLLECWNLVYLPSITPELGKLPPPDPMNEDEHKVAALRDELLHHIQHESSKLLCSGLESYLSQWPSHLHIDILPSHQRQGFGKRLIKTFCDAAKAQACPGVFLGMSASNDGAATFYESCGFRRLPYVLDNGASGEMGRTACREDGGATIYYVIDL